MEPDDVIGGRYDGYSPLIEEERREYEVPATKLYSHGIPSAGIWPKDQNVDKIALTLFREKGEWTHYCIHLDAVPIRMRPPSALTPQTEIGCWNILYRSTDELGSDRETLDQHEPRTREVYEQISSVLESGNFRLHLLHDGQMSLEELT